MRLAAVAGVVASTVACDRVTKLAASRGLAGRPRLSFLGDLFRLEYVENRGGFLSLGASLPEPARIWLFILGTAALLGWVGIMLARQVLVGKRPLGLALLWAGGLANLADRVARGRVVDFLNVGLGPVRTGIFNVADVAITLGAVLALLELVLRPRGRAAPGPPTAPPSVRSS
jgi:signal peptidase II